MKRSDKNRQRVSEGLRKRAEGLEAEERVIEYVLDEEGNRRAVKEKTQIKYYPPDVSAAKACLELEGGENFSEYTDEELAAEKERLFRELQAVGGKTEPWLNHTIVDGIGVTFAVVLTRRAIIFVTVIVFTHNRTFTADGVFFVAVVVTFVTVTAVSFEQKHYQRDRGYY